MATATRKVAEFVFEWEGRDRNGKQIRGETRASGENQAEAPSRNPRTAPTANPSTGLLIGVPLLAIPITYSGRDLYGDYVLPRF